MDPSLQQVVHKALAVGLGMVQVLDMMLQFGDKCIQQGRQWDVLSQAVGSQVP